MENLKVSIIQTAIHWEDVDANLAAYTKKIETLSEQTDLIVLPEMFASGFTMQGKEKISKRYDDIKRWMQSTAKTNNLAIMGSTIYTEEGKYYNRFIVAQADGTTDKYDKRHLFTMGEENEHFTAGTDKLLVDIKGWKIRPFVCYDLRFPVWSRNTDNYDIAIYSANWPEPRRDAWKTLLKARAIENQAYTIGVNCVGQDGNDLKYTGDSTIHNAKGQTIVQCEPGKEQTITAELSAEDLQKFRKNFPVLKDTDKFTITNK